MIFRIRHKFSFALAVMACGFAAAFGPFCTPKAASAAKPLPYAQTLDAALTAMEQGKHAQAVPLLLSAVQRERNEPMGLLALGTLYLHGGSPARAIRTFRRVRLLAPNESLGPWGEVMAGLCTTPPARLDSAILRLDGLALDNNPLPAAPVLASYLRLLSGANATPAEPVGADETDALRLEVAAFAALRGGDKERGEALLRAFLSRPGQNAFVEDRTLIAPFLPDAPLQSGAPLLTEMPTLTEPPANAVPLSGRTTLLPPGDLPPGTTVVSYEVEGGGGGYSASVNYPPFASEWNTARFPNGVYALRVLAQSGSGRVLQEWNRAVVLQNADAPLSSALTPAEQQTFRARLVALLTPRPSRKAAHFALAELAAGRGETETALTEMEQAAAIDPTFRGAITSLRRFNKETLGTRAGVWRGITDEKIVALTFDDGPNPDKTPALLDALKAAGVPATFFVVGVRAEQATGLLRRMVADGHEIANHSYSHPNLTYLEKVGVERELCRTSAIIFSATGKRPRFYRPPGGNYNTAVVDAAEELGMAGAYWTIDGVKYEQPPFTPPVLTQFVLKQLRPGAIILLHNAPDNTIAALPALVAGLRARGYQMVTMSELVRRSKAETLAPLAAKTGKVKNSGYHE